jgi:hypothetical protein
MFKVHLKESTKIYIGLELEDVIRGGNLDNGRIESLRTYAHWFYIELIKQLQKRFDSNNYALKPINYIDATKKSLSTLHYLFTIFPTFLHNLNAQKIDKKFKAKPYQLFSKAKLRHDFEKFCPFHRVVGDLQHNNFCNQCKSPVEKLSEDLNSGIQEANSPKVCCR